MPPGILAGGRNDRSSRAGAHGDKRSELVCRIKYNNTLPDIPFDPKYIQYPFESNRFVQYNPTSLERNYKFELLTEADLGVPIDLINPDTYTPDPSVEIDPEDEKLLEDEATTGQDKKRSKRHNTTVSWLRKTEYISTEYNRFSYKTDKAESRIGHNLKKLFKEEELYRDRDSQIKAIEATFDATKTEIIKHYSKPNVTAVEVLPVLPDFELWRNPCAQVIFDSDPAQPGKSTQEQIAEMSQAMIRGMVDEAGEQFVAYFLPTEETLGKRKRDSEAEVEYVEEEVYDYVLAREYNWNVKNKLSKGYQEAYFFVMRDNCIAYNELETRVRLNKRRKLGNAPVNKSRLLVTHRPMTEVELHQQDQRLTHLGPPQDEEEEEMQVDVAEDEDQKVIEGLASDTENADENTERKSRSRSRSASRSRSRSGSHRSGSGSRSRSRSHSGSRSRSRSRSRSHSGSRRSGSGSRSRSRSGSRSRSRSGSPGRSRSRSASGSRGSRSRSRSHSRSRSRSASHSPARSGSASGDDVAARDKGAAKAAAEEIFGSESDSD